MSPTAHSSSSTSTVVEGGGLPLADRTTVHGFTMDANGRAGSRGGKAPLPHIDDLLSPPMDVDINLPLRKILEMGDNAMRQAETYRDFNRPDLALKEFIIASVIAIKIIPRHSGYVSLRSGRADLNRIYRALMAKITLQQNGFEKIKADIIEDNKRTGVQPTAHGASSTSQQGNGAGGRPPSAGGQDNGSAGRPQTPSQAPQEPAVSSTPPPSNGIGLANGSPSAKPKPAVHPKPQALHGNAIKPGTGARPPSSTTTQDLAARLANLRGPVSSPGQDPRIRTHPIASQRPADLRQPVQQERPKMAVDTALPDLPKLPDAIYSPARGTVSNEAASLPSSTPRGLFSRTGSSASINAVAAANKSEYFVPTHSYPRTSTPPPPKAPSVSIPDGNTIAAEDLYQYIQKGSANIQILIIDVRSREDFDDGHIMSQSTICIEPILLRENISADELVESMVLSPAQEQNCFEQRDKYDLVVFYDQDSLDLPQRHTSNPEALALLSLQQALVHFNYGRELRNPLKLLEGGLDAWTDLVGKNALQTSSTLGVARTTPSRPQWKATNSVSKIRRKYNVTPLKPEEVKVWEQTLKAADFETAQSPGVMHVRTTEDFLRRFPAVSTEQESMTSPLSPDRPTQPYGSSHDVDVYHNLTAPPTRPAPAVPRPSYSGLSSNADDDDILQTQAYLMKPRNLKKGPFGESDSPSRNSMEDNTYFTGLNNPANWCYANSSIQALRMSPGFGRELASSSWQSMYKVPKTSKEHTDPPQLMSRMMANLFQWMGTGKFKVMKAQTLMDYSKSICQRGTYKFAKGEEFGGPRQQDAQEFISWLMANLHEETNMRRDQGDAPHETAPVMDGHKSMLQAAHEWWESHSKISQSIIDRYWRGIEVSTVACSVCKSRTHTWSAFDFLTVPLNGTMSTLEESLREYTAPEDIKDFDCDTCRTKVPAMRQLTLARMPELLCISLRRFRYDPATMNMAKDRRMLTWDFDHLDLDDFFLPRSERSSSSPLEAEFQAPFGYECYAVIIHLGQNISSGHYYCYVRAQDPRDPHAWYQCSDSDVKQVHIDGTDRGADISRQVFKKGSYDVPYLLFFRRKHGR